jgi:hypothetical protein
VSQNVSKMSVKSDVSFFTNYLQTFECVLVYNING